MLDKQIAKLTNQLQLFWPWAGVACFCTVCILGTWSQARRDTSSPGEKGLASQAPVPGQLCFLPPGSTGHPNIAFLLLASAALGSQLLLAPTRPSLSLTVLHSPDSHVQVDAEGSQHPGQAPSQDMPQERVGHEPHHRRGF